MSFLQRLYLLWTFRCCLDHEYCSKFGVSRGRLCRRWPWVDGSWLNGSSMLDGSGGSRFNGVTWVEGHFEWPFPSLSWDIRNAFMADIFQHFDGWKQNVFFRFSVTKCYLRTQDPSYMTVLYVVFMTILHKIASNMYCKMYIRQIYGEA